MLKCLIAFIFSLSTYSQISDRQILIKTSDKLNKIITVHYQSKNESFESGTLFLEFDTSVFLDFRNSTNIPRYYLENDIQLLFDGQRQIMSLPDEKLIVTNNKPSANNPLLLSLYHIKELLPQMPVSYTHLTLPTILLV